MPRFGFQGFVTRELAALVFWVFAVIIVISAALLMNQTGQWWWWLVAVFSIATLRVGCEGMAVLFHIHEALIDLREATVGAARDAQDRYDRDRQDRLSAASLRARAEGAGRG
ncbi:MAG TPA: hypothetical protein PK170_12805 [Anaerolineae bacterium]|nr:hypothetical protein [Anaerolineae bacterium]